MMEPVNSIGHEQEIEGVDHIPFALSRIFDFHKRKKKIKKADSPQKVILKGILILAVISALVYSKEIFKFAKDTLNDIILEESGVEIEWPDMEPIYFDMESYINDINVSMNAEGFWVKRYSDYEFLYEHVGMLLPEYEALSYNNITVSVSRMKKLGKIAMYVKYKGEEFYLTGTFGVKDLTPDDTEILYGTVPEKASYCYEYAGGRKAYFIDRIGDKIQTIYFEAGNILYRFYADDTEEAVHLAKEFIETMAKYENKESSTS